MEEIGKISHYFAKINVAAVVLKDKLSVGDKIRIKGKQTDFEQIVDSMEIQNKKVDYAVPGDVVGIRVADKVRKKDLVYRV